MLLAVVLSNSDAVDAVYMLTLLLDLALAATFVGMLIFMVSDHMFSCFTTEQPIMLRRTKSALSQLSRVEGYAADTNIPKSTPGISLDTSNQPAAAPQVDGASMKDAILRCG